MVATARGPTAGEVRAALHGRFARAERQGADRAEVTSGDLHREAGGYPKHGHGMRACCRVMRAEMRTSTDSVVSEPDGDEGASLTICYKVPRWPQ